MHGGNGVRLTASSVAGGVLGLVALGLFAHTFAPTYDVPMLTAGRGPVFFPRLLLGLMILCAAVVVWQGRDDEPLALPAGTALPVLAVVAATGLYVAGILTVGFLFATIGFTLVVPWLLGYRTPWVILALAAVYPVTVWYLFQEVFLIVLPSSPWFAGV